MNRFFSKLDLRDIKIDPHGSRFPPDGEEFLEEAETGDLLVEPAPVLARESAAPLDSDGAARRPYVPGWATGTAVIDGVERREDLLATETATSSSISAGNEPSTAEAEEHPTGGQVPVVARHGDVLKVSARSRPSAVAGAIAGVVRENGRAEVQAIGAGATNQAVKAVAMAREYLRETGIEAVCLPAFIDVMIDNEERTAIRLVVEPR